MGRLSSTNASTISVRVVASTINREALANAADAFHVGNRNGGSFSVTSTAQSDVQFLQELSVTAYLGFPLQDLLINRATDIHWLQPGVDADATSSVLSRAWETSQCPMLLAGCCLASAGHLDAVQPNRPGGNYAFYKARVLREVSERMQSPTTATSDETIGTLGCLLSFEVSDAQT